MYKNNSSVELIRKLKRPLFLQGPIGGFFRYLMKEFKEAGATPFKINFNGGDEYYMKGISENVFSYQGPMIKFGEYISDFLIQNRIDGIVLFGDCRPLHKVAIEIAKENNVAVFVFEEGYIRPNFITLEVNGVNANSPLMGNIELELKDFKVSNTYNDEEFQNTKDLQVKHFHDMKDMAIRAMRYWFHMELSREKFRYYEHHKDGDIFRSMFYWGKSYFKKKFYKTKESWVEDYVQKDLHQKYFLVALQVYNDSQIKDHSKFRNNKRFIYNVMKSFGKNANKGDFLVIKQHPLDVPYHNYSKFIQHLIKSFNLENRVLYVHDLHLPTLIKNSKGLITINSTTGLSSLYHKIPVITMGNALYNIKGLCFQYGLDRFWNSKLNVNYNTFKKFRNLLITKTQVVGTFYNEEHYPEIINIEQKRLAANRLKDVINCDRKLVEEAFDSKSVEINFNKSA